MYKLCFYVPQSHLEQVKSALFGKGAGRYKGYDHCCWQTLGTGQFRPLAGSKPFFGAVNQLATLPEYKVEMMCTNEVVKAVVQTLHDVHPYEQPAYDLYPVLELDNPQNINLP